MTTRSLAIALALSLLVCAAAYAAAKKIGPKHVGAVQIGMTYKEARDKGLIGGIREGCPLAGGSARAARLKAPLKGSVDLTRKRPRKIRNITVEGGAKARGVGIGATIPQIKDAFPKAEVDHSTDETFALTLVRIPKDGGGRFQFGVDTGTKKTVVIGVPYIAFCEKRLLYLRSTRGSSSTGQLRLFAMLHSRWASSHRCTTRSSFASPRTVIAGRSTTRVNRSSGISAWQRSS